MTEFNLKVPIKFHKRDITIVIHFSIASYKIEMPHLYSSKQSIIAEYIFFLCCKEKEHGNSIMLHVAVYFYD